MSKWRETIDPFTLPFKNFKLTDILGYPPAGNDVFYVKGIHQGETVYAFIKVARQISADILNEVEVVSKIDLDKKPIIIDYADNYNVTLAMEGEKLPSILKNELDSMDYLYEYGSKLAEIHSIDVVFDDVKIRKFHNIPEKDYCIENDIENVYHYLVNNKPKHINKCFCHGDFHYGNILWKDGHISAILDFELSGRGNKEYDIAWALVRRPTQKFMKTIEEVEEFLKGYESIGECNREYVYYYMIQIYSYFYTFKSCSEEYKTFVKELLKKVK